MLQIEKEHISPRSKLNFWLRGFVAIMSGLILLSFVVYLISFMLFALQKSGILYLSPFGFFGVFSIVNDLPWRLVFLSFFALFGVLLLAKNTFSVYRMPLVYLFLFIIGFVGITGLLVAKTRIHPFLVAEFDRRPKDDNFHMISHYVKPEAHNISIGVLVATTTDSGFVATLQDGTQVEIKTNDLTKYFTENGFQTGDEILILGERRRNILFAGAVREITRGEREDLELK